MRAPASRVLPTSWGNLSTAGVMPTTMQSEPASFQIPGRRGFGLVCHRSSSPSNFMRPRFCYDDLPTWLCATIWKSDAPQMVLSGLYREGGAAWCSTREGRVGCAEGAAALSIRPMAQRERPLPKAESAPIAVCRPLVSSPSSRTARQIAKKCCVQQACDREGRPTQSSWLAALAPASPDTSAMGLGGASWRFTGRYLTPARRR